MASDKDSIKNILVVALSVCLVCAIVVSGTAVSLKPEQRANKQADRSKNILIAAGLFEEGKTPVGNVQELFKEFTIKIVDLQEKRFLTDEEAKAAGINVETYDQRKASKNPALSKALPDDEDIASISRRARYSVVYMLEKQDGEVERIVLPIHGYGLWSTLYGFIALEGDLNTVAGITFYEQQETAGLGGEVENPDWKALWEGKKIYDNQHHVVLRLVKGGVDPNSPNAEHQVDALSGASLTSRGVENLVAYWLGDDGFGPLLAHMQNQQIGAI
ncbi:MAG: Na(+)-translocating NADH-quinone reductase subunit C [Pseudomonadales bacterium]|nr:Na(+)-translocating NADH-quinone reductase subunit C [Pseudomonadales bacterium]